MKILMLSVVLMVAPFSLGFTQGMEMVKGGTLFPGFSLPLGNFGDAFNAGFQFGFSVRSTIPGMENIDADWTIGLAKYGGQTGGIVKESEYRIIPITVNGILNLNPMASDVGGTNPFLLAGVGYYLLREIGTLETSETDPLTGSTYTYTLDYDYPETAAGINLGGGVMYFVNTNLFIEGYVKFHYILGEDGISLLDIRVGPGFYF